MGGDWVVGDCSEVLCYSLLAAGWWLASAWLCFGWWLVGGCLAAGCSLAGCRSGRWGGVTEVLGDEGLVGGHHILASLERTPYNILGVGHTAGHLHNKVDIVSTHDR